MTKNAILGLIIAMLLTACAGIDVIDQNDTISGHGIVKYIDLEGGFYGIVADGEHYIPQNLQPRFLIEDFHITFTAKVEKNAGASIQMWGRPITIVDIRERNDQRVLTIRGVVEYVDLEGGFYGIVADDGKRYRPVHELAGNFSAKNVRISLQAAVREDMMGIETWGTPIEILGIFE